MLSKLVDLSAWQSRRIILIPALYHLILAVLYGSALDSGYPDSFWYIGAGLAVSGAKDVSASATKRVLIAGTGNVSEIARDQPPVLPLFIAGIYELFGFPQFVNYLWIWNVLTMWLLLTATYHISYLLFDRRTAALATLLMGFNWHIGWYGQMLLVDVSVTAFAFTAILFYLRYLRSVDVRNLILSGLFSSIAFWTKMTSIYLHLPVLIILLLKKESRIKFHYFIIGFVIGQVLLAPICYLYGGSPLLPFVVSARAHLVGGGNIDALIQSFLQPSSIGLQSFSYLKLMPLSLGFPAFFFSILGIIHLVRQRSLMLPAWALYGLSIYSLAIRPVRDQYMVHFTPLFIVLASIGLIKVIERYKLSRVTVLFLVVLTVLFTNSARPLLFYSFSDGFVSPLFLHQRLGRNGFRDNLTLIIESL